MHIDKLGGGGEKLRYYSVMFSSSSKRRKGNKAEGRLDGFRVMNRQFKEREMVLAVNE